MVDNLSLPKILNITNKLKHIIHNEMREKFSEPHVIFRQIALVSVSYDFLESAPLPRDIRPCLCCEQHEHVFERCTDCPLLLSFSQHARACLFTTAYSSPSLYYLTFTGSPSWMPIGSGGSKSSCPVVGSVSISRQVRSLRSRRCGFTARASRTYVFCLSPPHTAELMPE